MTTLSMAAAALSLIAGGWFGGDEILGANLIDTLEWIKRNVETPRDESRSVDPFKAEGVFDYDMQGKVTWTYATERVQDQFGLVTKTSVTSTFLLADLEPESVKARHRPISVIATTRDYDPAIVHTRVDERSRFPNSKLRDKPVQIDTQRFHTTFVVIELDDYALAERVAKALRHAAQAAPGTKRPSGELF